MRRALLVVGKAPEPGLTKTRLVPPLSDADAADLYAGFLRDGVAIGLHLGWERVTVVHPRGSCNALQDLLPATVVLHEQPGDGLQDALTNSFEAHLSAGFERVVLISSDNPTLPPALLEQACAALDSHDLVFGPSLDGGYYLVGMHQPHPGVFEGIEWSTERVYAQTLARADHLGLRVHALPAWYDIDEPRDLERLQRDLSQCSPQTAPHTRAVLERLRLVAPTR